MQLKTAEANQSREVRARQKSLADALAIERSRNKSLEERLEIEQRKDVELNRLREFIFDIQSSADIQEVLTPLKDLIAGKNIYILGGHVNWRSKMKAAYPSLNLLDGHQKSLDEKIFMGADMILLYAAHMSHAVYDKTIAILRNNNIPFDYLGRTHNIDLLENEIAGILQGQSGS